jgi:membrane protease YdiL (CAAX protease family)
MPRPGTFGDPGRVQLLRPRDHTSRAGPTRPARWIIAAGLVLVALHNLLIAVGIDELGTLAVNLSMTTALVLLTLRRGWHGRDLGLRFERQGLLVAAGAGIATTGAVLVAAGAGLMPADASVSTLPASQVWFRVLVAIPVGTALCEETIFRGVLLAAADRTFGRMWSTVAVAGLFGLWHVAAEAARIGALSLAVTVGVVGTGAASAAVLCPLRRRTGGLAAPVAVHAATNVTVLLAMLAASGGR